MKPVDTVQALWEPIRALPPHQREKLEAEVHHALNVANARIRNTDPKYSEQLQKVEKETWYELAQLCEEYGVSMEPFYVHRRNSERLWKALEQPGAIRETMEMMGMRPRRNKTNPSLINALAALFIIALLILILFAATIHP
jgi:hypothetical protein